VRSAARAEALNRTPSASGVGVFVVRRRHPVLTRAVRGLSKAQRFVAGGFEFFSNCRPGPLVEDPRCALAELEELAAQARVDRAQVTGRWRLGGTWGERKVETQAFAGLR
jgi:hypothetical protein